MTSSDQLHLFFRRAARIGPVPTQLPLFIALPRADNRPSRGSLQDDARAALGKATAEVDVALQAEDGGDPSGLGGRWAAALRRLYPPPHSVKQVARAFAVEMRTAKGWLGGQSPASIHLCRLAMMHGPVMALAVLGGCRPATADRVAAALDEMAARLAELRDGLAAGGGS